MSDILDMAQHYDELYRQSALRAHFAGRDINFTGDDVEVGNSGQISVQVRQCSDCGDEIKAARLEAIPQATRCIDCQAEHERICGRSA